VTPVNKKKGIRAGQKGGIPKVLWGWMLKKLVKTSLQEKRGGFGWLKKFTKIEKTSSLVTMIS